MVTIELPWPPSVNHYYASRVLGKRAIRFITKRGKSFRQEVIGIVAPYVAKCKEEFGGKRIKLNIKLRSPDRRRRDVDNICKALLDSLESAGAYEDDSLIDCLSIQRDVNDIIKDGRAIVTIEANT